MAIPGAGAGATAAAMRTLRSAGQRLKQWCLWWPPEKKKNARLLFGSLAVAGALWSTAKRVPGGYVGFIQFRDGTVTPYLWEEQSIFPFLPYFQKPVTLRVMPAYKKMSRVCKTKDGKEVEVAVRVRLQPKIAYVPEIYLRFGREFGRAFLSEELSIDVNSVVSQHTYAELVKHDATTDAIEEDLIQRFHDAAAFHKIIISEASVVFRHPDDDE